MAEYDEILRRAKKGALERAAALKDATDVRALLPPILKNDPAFMEELSRVTGTAS
jgi:hypothetical protein